MSGSLTSTFLVMFHIYAHSLYSLAMYLISRWFQTELFVRLCSSNDLNRRDDLLDEETVWGANNVVVSR